MAARVICVDEPPTFITLGMQEKEYCAAIPFSQEIVPLMAGVASTKGAPTLIVSRVSAKVVLIFMGSLLFAYYMPVRINFMQQRNCLACIIYKVYYTIMVVLWMFYDLP